VTAQRDPPGDVVRVVATLLDAGIGLGQIRLGTQPFEPFPAPA